MPPHMLQLHEWVHGEHGACFYTGRKLILGAVAIGISVKLYNMYKRKQRRQKWSEAGKDVVVLHQFERGTNVPNLSPFALKLETYIRMANIKYIIDTEEPQGPVRSKCPWITINGEELSDSELIIDYLSRRFPQPFEQLSAKENGIGRAIQVMLDESASIIVFYKRYQLDRMKNVLNMFPKKYRYPMRVMKYFMSKRIHKYFWIVGIGRFSEDEAMFFLHRDIQSLEDILGNNTFLFGSAPSVYDAAVFSELTQIIYCCAPETEKYVRSKHERLVQYHERMKNKYWPDWEQCRAE